MRIMIADDNAEMRNFLKSILQGAGVEFVECRDGGEAMACFAAQRPEWTVMDVWMKPVDGFTATRDILARFPGSRVLIITQDDNPRLKTEARAAGACGFLLKDDLPQLSQIVSASATRGTRHE